MAENDVRSRSIFPLYTIKSVKISAKRLLQCHFGFRILRLPFKTFSIPETESEKRCRLRRTNSTSRAEDIVTEDAKVAKNIKSQFCKKKSKSQWAKKKRLHFFLQSQQRQVRRSQPDKPIHSPRDSLISWRFITIIFSFYS